MDERMTPEIADRGGLILGGTPEIGLAFARVFAEAGAVVRLVGRNTERGRAAAGALGDKAGFLAANCAGPVIDIASDAGKAATPSLVEGMSPTGRLMDEGTFAAKLTAKARPLAGLGAIWPEDLAALEVFLASPPQPGAPAGGTARMVVSPRHNRLILDKVRNLTDAQPQGYPETGM